MKYEDMSDHEINIAVALIKYRGLMQLESDGNGVFVSRVEDKYDFVNIVHSNFNPCCSPSDAWPIIVENKIAIDFIDGYGWTANPAFNCSISVSCYDEPLRAAMICFLKMKDAE